MRFLGNRLTGVALALAVVGASCAKPAGDGAQPRADMNLLTRQIILDNHFSNAYDAVESLRSNWLLTKGTDSFTAPTEVLVYLNNTKLGGVSTLRDIGSPTVTFIRHYDGIQATARWGLGHGAGVIFVSTRADGGEPGSKVLPATKPPTN